jgi:hypothetical protein
VYLRIGAHPATSRVENAAAATSMYYLAADVVGFEEARESGAKRRVAPNLAAETRWRDGERTRRESGFR